MQTEYSHNCLISCYQFVTEWDVKRNIDSIFNHMHQFSDRQRPKLHRGVQEIKSWIVQAISLGEKFIYVELSNSSIQLWNVCRKPQVSKYKKAKRDCRTARSWSTRHCNKQDSAKTEASSSMSLPSNILLYETDSKFNERFAAHRLLSPDRTQINFANYFE